MFSFLVILAGLFWGLLSIFVNGTIDAGFSTFQCVALRLFFTFLILFIIILIKNKRFPKIDIKDCIFFLGMGLGCLGSSVFYFLAIKEIGNAGIPAMLLDTSPIFVVFFSAVLFRDKITIKKIIALILCCVGVVFTTGVIGGTDQVPITGILIGVLAGFSYAIYSIINKILVKKYDSLVITAYAFLFATVFIVPFCGIFNKLYLLNNVKTDLYVLALALVGTVIPFVLYSIGLKHMNASIVSILATSELIMASIVGALFYDEKFTIIKIIGSLSILAAIIILNVNFKKKKNT